ncbi:Prickle planar cell polarity protein 3, partial [Frankliniella fusca]
MTVRCARGPGPAPAPIMAGRSGAAGAPVVPAGGGGGGGAPAKKMSGGVGAALSPLPPAPPPAGRASPGRAAAAPEAQAQPQCPLSTGLIDTRLIPWPGMRFACVRVLELYCKVFNQAELYELIIRKTCQSCKCPRESHDVYHEEWVNVCERLGFRTDLDQDGAERAGGLRGNPGARSTKERAQAEGYSWVPPGLPSHKIAEYFSSLPADKVPQLGGPGEKHRDRQLVSQLPKQDLALAYCRHVDKQHHASYEDFIHARNEIALDIGYVQDHASQDLDCPECGRTVAAHEVAVVAPKLGANMRWHPACFTCSQCHELLVDLTYCVHDDALFCERHYAEQLKPRCASCDE